MKRVTILGVTGSVGQKTVDVAKEYPDLISVVCISAHQNLEALAKIANELHPPYIALTDENADAALFRERLDYKPAILQGKNALVEACTAGEPDLVLLSVLGIAGLPAFVECLKHKITVALANKESLVCGAGVVQRMIEESGTLVLPVDSEHSAFFQCLNNGFKTENVQNFWITASGGPFLHWTKEQIENAPLDKALKHPRWAMGRKITIDSASLANKGLEVIEAHYMYRIPPERIKVLIHPQSMVHSMVEWKDCSVTAQLGPVDMRMPIQKALLYPDMRDNPCLKPLDFYEISNLEFIRPDLDRFPCLALAFDSISNQTTAVYNSANEEAVAHYLSGEIHFGRISELIQESLEKFAFVKPKTIDEILLLDKEVRLFVDGLIA